MNARLVPVMAVILALISPVPPAAQPQGSAMPATAQAAAPLLTPERLEQLLAPIALYPDPLLAQILMAATYPLEVVEADRWLQAPGNAALKGDRLAAALQRQTWDPSAKSLVAFPQILHMMDSNLEWTEELGDAFLAQPADVMDAVQRLRERAEAAGSLASTPQQTVSTEEEAITIEPASPEIVYIAAYNPWCVYGSWPYPAGPPFYFGTWSGECAPADAVLAFDGGIYPPFGFWAWGSFDWRRHRVRIDHDRFQSFHPGHEPPGGIWQHDAAHRRGVPYRDPGTAARFLGAAAARRREFRGFAPAPEAVPRATPAAPSVGHAPAPAVRRSPVPAAPQRAGPPAFESFGRGGQVRGEAARGFSSRMAPAPSIRAAPAPSFQAAPAPSFHSGGGGGRR